MKLLMVADGRSPTTRGWIDMLKPLNARIFLVSTFPCAPVDGVEDVWVLPVAMGSLAGGQISSGSHTRQRKSIARRLISRLRPMLTASRYVLGPLTLPAYRDDFLEVVQKVKPDLVHALRIPFEGMLASCTPSGVPLIASIWGNDLTLHASRSSSMARWTRRTLMRADGLMADTRRDILLAGEWGLCASCPTLVVPGGGGVELDKLQRDQILMEEIEKILPVSGTLIINPRGLRPGSINAGTFFKAANLVIEQDRDVHFLCAAMKGQGEALGWVKKLELQNNVHLLPYLAQDQLWALYRRCPISLSVSMHDGTPNTLLEAMALGCFPICGDIPSIREWIADGKNGLLVPPEDHAALAGAIRTGLSDEALRKSSAALNRRLVNKRAHRKVIQRQAADFYDRFGIHEQ